MSATDFYVVRYLPQVPLNKRKHEFTLGTFSSWDAAEDHRVAQPVVNLLDVERRTKPA